MPQDLPGHTATAFALARVLARRYPERRRLFYTLAGLVGLSRIGLYAADHAGSLPVLRLAF